MPKNSLPKPPSRLQHQASDEERAWLDTAPVGREFGSPDYERLTALDQAAFAAFQSWERVRDWLVTPNAQLGGACPEDASRRPDGLSKVMSILMMAGGHASEDFMRDVEEMPVQERDSLRGLAEIKKLKGMFGRPALQVSIEDMNPAIARRGARKK
nr:antitoxin Xre/MbcA/ParS toxin-binding domain-containing protein [uncultured Roseateles sp.]